MSEGLNNEDARKLVRVGSLFAGVITLIPGALMLADAAMGFGWLGARAYKVVVSTSL